MKDRVLIVPTEYPYVEFGEAGKVREIRMPISPEYVEGIGIRLVTATVPAGAKAEGHIHPDADEIIRFDIPGKAIVDGVEYDVPAGGIIHARSGMWHECVNTDPEKTLTLYCVFTPVFKPYSKYPELIEMTKKYLEEN